MTTPVLPSCCSRMPLFTTGVTGQVTIRHRVDGTGKNEYFGPNFVVLHKYENMYRLQDKITKKYIIFCYEIPIQNFKIYTI